MRALRSIRQLPEVELEQLSPLGRNECRRHLRPGECLLHLNGRGRADDDRTACLVRLVQLLRVADLVEHEGIVEIELALDGDLRNAPPRRSEPALSQIWTVPPGSIASTWTF